MKVLGFAFLLLSVATIAIDADPVAVPTGNGVSGIGGLLEELLTGLGALLGGLGGRWF